MNFFFVVLLFSLISLSIVSGGNEKASSSGASSSVPEVSLKVVKMDKSNCACRLRSSKKIIGGEIAEAYSIPWQVSLARSDNNKHFCGATIINHNYILTAAHCVNNEKEEGIKVRVGIYYINDTIPIEKTYDVEKIIYHPFIDEKSPGDIALLKIKGKIKFITNKVEPGCLNFIKKEYSGQLMASGWGVTTEPRKDHITKKLIIGDSSPVLKIAILKECGNGSEFLICADSDRDDTLCNGDSGGPLHFFENGLTSIEGIFSSVNSKKLDNGDTLLCSESKALFTRLSFYKKWAEDFIGNNYCSLIGDNESDRPRKKIRN